MGVGVGDKLCLCGRRGGRDGDEARERDGGEVRGSRTDPFQRSRGVSGFAGAAPKPGKEAGRTNRELTGSYAGLHILHSQENHFLI